MDEWTVYGHGKVTAELVVDCKSRFSVSFVFADTRVFMTVAVDLVIEGIQEPVRFLIETRAKIFPTNERFWYFSTKPHVEQFVLKLKEVGLEI